MMCVSLTILLGLCNWAHQDRPRISIIEVPLEYRILVEDQFQTLGRLNSYVYRVSVNRQLERQDFERLICKIVPRAEPADYDYLSVFFYYNLKEYHPDLAHYRKQALQQLANSEISARALGSYIWNRELGGKLNIYDRKCDLSEGSFPLDHLELCSR